MAAGVHVLEVNVLEVNVLESGCPQTQVESGFPTFPEVTLGVAEWFGRTEHFMPPKLGAAGASPIVILSGMKRRNDTRFAPGRTDLTDGAGATSKKTKRPTKVKPSSLRIIGGDFRGRLVHYHGDPYTRPMKDSVRESLFNIVGRACRGAICFDLFAGTGALALEAISRGAVAAVAVEQSRQAAWHIKQTATQLGLSNRLSVHTGDAFRWANRLLGPPESDTPWIVLLSPPYVMWEESLEALNAMIRMTMENAPPGSLLVAETDKRFDVAKLPAGEWDVRRYGGTQLAIIECAQCCGLRM